jgi:hypothetical protein
MRLLSDVVDSKKFEFKFRNLNIYTVRLSNAARPARPSHGRGGSFTGSSTRSDAARRSRSEVAGPARRPGQAGQQQLWQVWH